MKLVEDFREKEKVQDLVALIKNASEEKDEYRIMEVCGTHTMSISRFGLRSLLPENVSLISGPGCPVCVTTQGELDAVFKILDHNDICLLTFGDLMRVPGLKGQTLLDYRAEGHDIRIVTSPLDCLEIAKQSAKDVVFIGIGFETTAPTIAATIHTAKNMEIQNFSVIPFLKTMPEVMNLLLSDRELTINGFLCPGHVTAVAGEAMYQPIVDSGRSAVVTGFEPVDILYSVYSILNQVNRNQYQIENLYKRAVQNIGNPVALKMLYQVFEKINSEWRGIGLIENSGLGFRDDYLRFSAFCRYSVEIEATQLQTGCRCGDVLKGKILPSECGLFRNGCSPLDPAGPCMVSTEGACAAYYKYSSGEL